MSKEELHSLAEQTTPSEVSVPQTWTGLVVWALGKWGIGVVGFALLVPVYQDLKMSNARFYEVLSKNSEVSHQHVRAIEALATSIENGNAATERLEQAIHELKAVRNP